MSAASFIFRGARAGPPSAKLAGLAASTLDAVTKSEQRFTDIRRRENPPDLVADLRGPATQPIEVALAGKTDSVKGALRNTFELVPDAPVDTFRLELFGGKRGLIELSSGLCANPRASVKLGAQNGRVYDTTPKVRADCGRHRKGGGGGGKY